MGIIYIGDRETGKTHLAMELANPDHQYVQVYSPDYEELKRLLYSEEKGGTRATSGEQATIERLLEIQVQLPTGNKQVMLDWIDTPGEIWRKSWQADNPTEWENFLETIKESQGVLLIIPPYRELLKPGIDVPEDNFITKEQWCNRFRRWLDFFRLDCPKIRHLVICLNKADLFCDPKQEARKLAYHPYNSKLNWQQRNEYVFRKYFRPIQSDIKQLNQSISGLSVRCFITSIYNRELLELPWIYLGSFLAV
ncbi:UNVERIFIED_CONTAM: hypothetical protein BEN50_10410 [Euhalothece sp. KZN 001]